MYVHVIGTRARGVVTSRTDCDSAERTAGRNKAKLNTPARRQMKNGSVRTA